jgi:hypothetical protein
MGLAVVDSHITQVQLRAIAEGMVTSRSWDDVVRKVGNIISLGIITKIGYDYFSETWNLICDLIPANVYVYIKDNSVLAFPETQINTEVNMNCMHIVSNHIHECEYFEHLKTNDTQILFDWLVQGHLPCGWEGDYPYGKLIIY